MRKVDAEGTIQNGGVITIDVQNAIGWLKYTTAGLKQRRKPKFLGK